MKPGWNIGRKKTFIGLVGLLVLIIIVASLWAYEHGRNKNISSSGPTYQQVASVQNNQAESWLKQKNYQQAEYSYISAATAAATTGDIHQAIAILQTAENKIPEQYTSWHLYDTLAGLAKMENNRTLEIDSLQKALIKAQQSNSGAGASVVAAYTKRLKELGAD